MAETIKHNAPPKSKTALAKELNISRGSLYYQPSLPAKDQRLRMAIEQVMNQHSRYGHRRIALALGVNKKRVKRVMKLFGLKVRRQRRQPFKPLDIGQKPLALPNLLATTVINRPNQGYGSDFTYLPFQGKFVYLATLEDLFTREIVGWSVSLRHDANLVINAFDDVLMKAACPELIHSDQGSEYRSKKYLNYLKQLKIQVSMSAKGQPWQNGKQESFYSEFKLELGHPEAYGTLGELIEAIALQIHYYNQERIHTALKCPPAVFKQKYRLNLAVTKTTNTNLISQPNLLRLTV